MTQVHMLEFESEGHYYKFYFDSMDKVMDHIEENNIKIPDKVLMGDISNDRIS